MLKPLCVSELSALCPIRTGISRRLHVNLFDMSPFNMNIAMKNYWKCPSSHVACSNCPVFIVLTVSGSTLFTFSDTFFLSSTLVCILWSFDDCQYQSMCFLYWSRRNAVKRGTAVIHGVFISMLILYTLQLSRLAVSISNKKKIKKNASCTSISVLSAVIV